MRDYYCLFFTLLYLSVLQLSTGQGDQCGSIGVDRGEQPQFRRGNSMYMSVGYPAGCRGNITSFSYCYYPPNNNDPRYVSTFAIYRESSTNSGEYNSVSRTLIAQRTRSEVESQLDYDDDEFNRDFACADLTLDVPVTVEAGDVIGACIHDPPSSAGSIEQLDMIGYMDSNQEMLMRTGDSGCSESTVPQMVTSLDITPNRILHLYANIEPLPVTEPTTDPPTTTANPTTIGVVPTTGASTSSIPADLQTTVGESEMTSEQTSDTIATTIDENQSTGGYGGTVAAVVVILLIVLASLAATAVVIVVIWTRKQRLNKMSYPVNGVDNMMYSITEDETKKKSQAASNFTAEYEEIGHSQEHVYELENYSVRMNENTYAEVGPYGEMKEEIIMYESPLDATAISFARLLEKNVEEDIYGGENPYQTPATKEDDIYAQLKTWGVLSVGVETLEVVGHLGSGQFGSVEQGLWKRQGTKPVDVALKSLNKESSEEDKVKFLQEAAIMAQFRHPNVILLRGVVSSGEPMRLVVELAKRGDLRNFLLSIRPDPGELVPGSTPHLLLKFSQQVALGMQYLSAKGFVHRDLAARNVLVSNDNVCKVADFGMSRDLADENYYISQGRDKIPVKWTAPEAIHYKKYSTASDVWAYGCLLYEIWSVGFKPFEGISNFEAITCIDSGRRLPPPPGCSKMVYELMVLCWHPETSLRPGFRDVVLTLVGNEQMVLNIPEEDSSTNSLAGVLGAPLEAGENMYTDSQKRYI